MFPNLGFLIRWLTGWSLSLPIPTFGFCMALAFWGAYWVFGLEMRRKQRLTISPGTGSRSTDGPVPSSTIAQSADPVPSSTVALSADLARRLGLTPAGGPVPESIDVPRLMDRLLLFCGLIGFAGALLLAKLEDTYNLIHHPWNWLIRYHGLTYFGGLLFGAVTYLVILRRRGISLATAADIGSPGMMLAYAVGRMGCHLAGDGDWGIIPPSPKPDWLSWAPDWFWSAHYPHNVLRQGVYLSGCRGDYCTVLPDGVFPTSLYEFLVCMTLFFVLWILRRRLPIPGTLFFVYALFTGIERFLVEYIRITPRHVLLGLSLTQAQWISLGFIGIGLTGIGYILTTSAKKAYIYQPIVCPDRSSKKVRH